MSVVPDFDQVVPVAQPAAASVPGRRAATGGSPLFWRVKSVADVIGAFLLLPMIVALALILVVLNPVLNPGPLFYKQKRMGHRLVPFTAYKFRTMTVGRGERGHNDPVEHERITPLGQVLRRMGLDELPQALNILRGEMSLIGPRPDCLHHAEAYLSEIPDYHQRYCIRPGLSGLAQINHGYAVGTEATRAKVRMDVEYLRRAGFGLDAWIVYRTLVTIAMGRGD